MVDELKPCPFCGETDIRLMTTMNGCDIWCSSCYATIAKISYLEYNTLADVNRHVKPKAVAAWNRRTENG